MTHAAMQHPSFDDANSLRAAQVLRGGLSASLRRVALLLCCGERSERTRLHAINDRKSSAKWQPVFVLETSALQPAHDPHSSAASTPLHLPPANFRKTFCAHTRNTAARSAGSVLTDSLRATASRKYTHRKVPVVPRPLRYIQRRQTTRRQHQHRGTNDSRCCLGRWQL